MRSFARRERRLVALALLVGAMALVWLGVASPIMGGFQARAERRQALLARYQADQRLLASMPVFRMMASAQRRTGPAYQISAPSEGLAVDALRQRVAAAMTAAGGAVGSVQPVRADIPKGWISVRVDAQLNLTQFVTSLRQLENEAPYVVVEYASLGADRALQSGHAAPMDVRLQVSALFHPSSDR